MLFFCEAAEKDLDRIRRDGLGTGDDAGVELWTDLAALKKSAEGAVLVVDPQYVRLPTGIHDGRLRANDVAPEGILNIDPYLVPEPVTAAGGCIVRKGAAEPELLLIFRRGVWDLPKGKLDHGESVEECALREVREEIGISDLEIVRELGATVHGYGEKGRYLVKTTFWYLMQTAETAFTPQQEEDIEDVTWAPWSEALEKLGYETLRAHLTDQAGAVRAALG